MDTSSTPGKPNLDENGCHQQNFSENLQPIASDQDFKNTKAISPTSQRIFGQFTNTQNQAHNNPKPMFERDYTNHQNSS